MRLTRRKFLAALRRSLATAAGFAAVLATGQSLLGRRTTQALYPGKRRPYQGQPVGIIRPPGAVDEKEFLAGCIRCYRCQDVCDAGAIQFFTEQDGRYFHTPYVDPAKAACDLCMACTQTCPTGVLQPLRPKDRAQVRMASVALDKDRCLSYKAKSIRHQQRLLMELGRPHTDVEAEAERRGICGECYMVCPRRGHAITYEPGAFLAPVISDDDCVGCGLCEEICRVVLRGSEPAIRVVPTRSAI
jgi:ferredoxin-type protein NapG